MEKQEKSGTHSDAGNCFPNILSLKLSNQKQIIMITHSHTHTRTPPCTRTHKNLYPVRDGSKKRGGKDRQRDGDVERKWQLGLERWQKPGESSDHARDSS